VLPNYLAISKHKKKEGWLIAYQQHQFHWNKKTDCLARRNYTMHVFSTIITVKVYVEFGVVERYTASHTIKMMNDSIIFPTE